MFTVAIEDWFKGELHGSLRHPLQGSELVAQMFEPARIADMLERHRDGSANFTRELRALAAAAVWHAGMQ